MRFKPGPSRFRRLLSIVAFLVGTLPLLAVSLEELRSEPDLTPEKFANHFRNFRFDFRAEVQDPEAFLRSESGDCDDYAVLASFVLKEKGYTPHLIAIRMPKVVHVVCYIEETHSYLDYNDRKESRKTIPCSAELHDIAGKVAKSFSAPWSTASEFTFERGLKRLVATVSRQDKVMVAAGGRPPATGRSSD